MMNSALTAFHLIGMTFVGLFIFMCAIDAIRAYIRNARKEKIRASAMSRHGRDADNCAHSAL